MTQGLKGIQSGTQTLSVPESMPFSQGVNLAYFLKWTFLRGFVKKGDAQAGDNPRYGTSDYGFPSHHPRLFRQPEASQQFIGLQPLLARQLQGTDTDKSVGRGDADVAFAIRQQGAGGEPVGLGQLFGLEYLHHHCRAVGQEQLGPGGRIGGETAYKVVNALHRPVPVDAASLFEYLRCGAQLADDCHFFLGDGLYRAVEDGVYCFGHQLPAECHQLVVHDAYVVRVGNGDTHLLDDFAGVDLMAQEEGGDARFRVSVDDGPVDGGGSAVLRQE